MISYAPQGLGCSVIRAGRVARTWVVAIVAATMVACGGGDRNVPPVANVLTVEAIEDSVFSATLSGSDANGDRLTFRVVSPSRNGTVQLESTSGQFTYLGNPDFNGADTFSFISIDTRGARSAPAEVSIQVSPVNDAPRIQAIPDSGNSAQHYEVRVPYSVLDPEGDAIGLSVEIDDDSIAVAELDLSAGVVVLRPGLQGATRVSLHASDSELSSTESFDFIVQAVTKQFSIGVVDLASAAMQISNVGFRDVEFGLRHGGRALAGSIGDLVEEAGSHSGTPMERPERNLWAYVNNNTYHWHSLTAARWVHDPLILLNSVGFGLCDDVASALVLLARSAGLSANVWTLEGHVVAEIDTGARPGVFDPDLSVYYLDDDGVIADMRMLENDTTLITSPRNPVLVGAQDPLAYSDYMAAIYGSTTDNHADQWNTQNAPAISGRLRLPPGGSLTYPGVWAKAPHSTGGVGADAPVFANLVITLPTGWTGVMQMPLVLKAMHGLGRVRVGTGEYEIGSTALDVSLDVSPNWISDIEILRSDGPIDLVFLLNPLRFGELDVPEVSATGVDVWALDFDRIELPEANRRSGQPTEQFRKPIF